MKCYFDYSSVETEYLTKRDKALGRAIEQIGPLKREVQPDLFTALIKSMIGQQISIKAQNTVWGRLIELIGEVTPTTILSLTDSQIQACGTSYKKASYILQAAERISSGNPDLNALLSMPDHEVCRELSTLHGVGIWTAEMLMLFSMQRRDILSYGDLAIIRGMKMLYRHKEVSKERFEKYRKRYSPYGSVASLYLWEIAGGAPI